MCLWCVLVMTASKYSGVFGWNTDCSAWKWSKTCMMKSSTFLDGEVSRSWRAPSGNEPYPQLSPESEQYSLRSPRAGLFVLLLGFNHSDFWAACARWRWTSLTFSQIDFPRFSNKKDESWELQSSDCKSAWSETWWKTAAKSVFASPIVARDSYRLQTS